MIGRVSTFRFFTAVPKHNRNPAVATIRAFQYGSRSSVTKSNNKFQHHYFKKQQITRMSSSASDNYDNKKQKNASEIIKQDPLPFPLVSMDTCIQLHGLEGIVFIDGSWYLKDRDGRKEYENGPRISNAHFFDIDDIAETSMTKNPKKLPHMMPTKTLFASAMDAMNISNEDHLIIYAGKDCPMVYRAYFQIRSMGHPLDHVHIMDGTLHDWEKKGGPIEKGFKKALVAKDDLDITKPTKYIASDPKDTVTIEELKTLINANANGEDDEDKKVDTIILDARSRERFIAEAPEPREGLRLGHMPGAENLPFMELLDPTNIGRLKPQNELQQIIKEKYNIDPTTEKKIITTCGSGATACTLLVALEICNRKPGTTLVYDGSWCEWGSEPDTPIVK